MKNKKSVLILTIALILLLTLSCSLSEESQPENLTAATKVALTVAAIGQPAGQQPAVPSSPDTSDAAQPPAPSSESTQPPSIPTSLWSTLASLDSYTFMMKYHQITKVSSENTIIEMTMDRSEKDDAMHALMKTQNPVRIADMEGSSEISETETWKVGDISCTKEDGEYKSKRDDKTETDNTTDLLELMDITPRIDNPEFIGVETVNGIPSNHFKFKIANYLDKSGWLVTRNEGEYWLAQDGQYMVKYILYLDSSSAPEDNPKAESNKIFLTQELKNINEPVEIKLPSACPPPTSN
jgi:uncharacterized lipoprotein YehR (DUF1307 family)